MSVDEIAKRLSHRFELLVSGKRGALPRQQTLRGLIDWSYELLDEEERVLFNRLSVFAGGWTLDAATKVCADKADEWHVLRLMTSLVTKSVVGATETAPGNALSLPRDDQAIRRGVPGGEQEATARARLHLDYFVDLAENSEGSFYSEHQLAWFDRIEADHDNYRRALARATGTPSPGSALRLAGALWRFWATRGYVSEGRIWRPRSRATMAPRMIGGARCMVPEISRDPKVITTMLAPRPKRSSPWQRLSATTAGSRPAS